MGLEIEQTELSNKTGKRITVLDFSPELLFDNNNCVNCRFESSFPCNRKFCPEAGIEEYFQLYNAKIEIWEFPEDWSKAKIRDQLYSLTLKRHREGKYWVLTFANFHCADTTKECSCYSDRCWNFKEVPNRHIFRCTKYWFNLPEEYTKENIGVVVA